PRAWEVRCPEDDCNPSPLKLGADTTALLEMCRMSDAQLVGFMRHMSGCSHRSRPRIIEWQTITELLALPAASADAAARDYREKVIALVGTLANSNIRYRATGTV